MAVHKKNNKKKNTACSWIRRKCWSFVQGRQRRTWEKKNASRTRVRRTNGRRAGEKKQTFDSRGAITGVTGGAGGGAAEATAVHLPVVLFPFHLPPPPPHAIAHTLALFFFLRPLFPLFFSPPLPLLLRSRRVARAARHNRHAYTTAKVRTKSNVNGQRKLLLQKDKKRKKKKREIERYER